MVVKSSQIVTDSWRTRGRRVVDPIRIDYSDIKSRWGQLMDTYFHPQFHAAGCAGAHKSHPTADRRYFTANMLTMRESHRSVKRRYIGT
ncbi:MAG: hypothetical protein EBR00_02210 [Gammaproteobacteria bacterium]|nr:hypothetical protein [Gammaproteobacteria bacterium]